jgi:hypothetical protein
MPLVQSRYRSLYKLPARVSGHERIVDPGAGASIAVNSDFGDRHIAGGHLPDSKKL